MSYKELALGMSVTLRRILPNPIEERTGAQSSLAPRQAIMAAAIVHIIGLLEWGLRRGGVSEDVRVNGTWRPNATSAKLFDGCISRLR